MKTCVDCKNDYQADDFPLCGGNGKRAARCRPCKQQYDRAYYLANKDRMKGQRKLTRPESKRKIQQAVWDYLADHPCPCGEPDPVVLEFDHRDPEEKSFNIAQAVNSHYSLERIMAEIEKCDVLCANCHRRRTALQFGWYSLLQNN